MRGERVEAEVIAKGLSKAQRDMLASSRRDHLHEPPRCYGPGITKKALRERGLGHGDYCYLTSLGLAVREALAPTQTEGDGL